MQAMMMHRNMKVADILTYAAETHPHTEIVSRRAEGDLHRTTYAQTAKRVAKLAHALVALGMSKSDRIATLAWNGYRHFELYYAISGAGGVCHTINPRLSTEQMLYIVRHADDKVLFLDLTFVPMIEALAAQFPEDLRFVLMTDRAHMPDSPVEFLCYEDLLDNHSEQFNWPDIDENDAAGLCYTSGTTGNPKGTLFSHRSTVLHAMTVAIALPNSLKQSSRILPVVPLFHVNAWGLPYAAPLTGASLIFPGPGLDGESLYNLMESEQVFSAWGVPTVWLGLLAQIEAEGRIPSALGDVVIGGSAAPRSMIEAFETNGVNVCHAWGMTEMSPVGTQGNLPPHLATKKIEERLDIKVKQGRRVFGVELKIVDENRSILPHDGKAVGELFVAGNTIASGYFNDAEATETALDKDGWFGTGDMATIDAEGFLTITDRAKDLIKSGGEWISSLDLENAAMAHQDVANCAVIAVPHPKWDERPLLIVVPTEGATPDKSELLKLLTERFAKWQVPDDVVFVDALPLTATGKISKLTLRSSYADYVLHDG